MKLKKMTIAALKRDDACEPGMAFVTPLIKAKDPELNAKLFAENAAWWGWAAGRKYDVWDGIDLGPQTEHIQAFVFRCFDLTRDEADKLHAAWYAAWYAARYAARDAVAALVVRDLIGQHGFTQEHYDTLTGPWRKVIGPVHPDDAPLSVDEVER